MQKKLGRPHEVRVREGLKRMQMEGTSPVEEVPRLEALVHEYASREFAGSSGSRHFEYAGRRWVFLPKEGRTTLVLESLQELDVEAERARMTKDMYGGLANKLGESVRRFRGKYLAWKAKRQNRQ